MVNISHRVLWLSCLLIFCVNTASSEDNPIKKMADSIKGLFVPDPDVGRTAQQLIKSRAFGSETHHVTTQDGYILGVVRITNAKIKGQLKGPVLLQHSLMASAQCWLNNSPLDGLNDGNDAEVGHNLGFELAKRGYDVWLGNSRGTDYSKNHTKFHSKSKAFWNFSIDEMIKYDMPATIDYILNITKHPTIGYVGYNQGTALMFGLLASETKYSDIIKPFIALGPLVLVNKETTAPLMFKQSGNGGGNKMIDMFAKKEGSYLDAKAMRNFGQSSCKNEPQCYLTVKSMEPFMGRQNIENTNVTRWSIYLFSESLSESAKNIHQWNQQYAHDNRKFTMYDYGEKSNNERYGQSTPKPYDLSQIKNKYISVYYSENDGVVGPEDVHDLELQVSATKMEMNLIHDKEFSHSDFLFGKNTDSMINSKVVETIQKYDE